MPSILIPLALVAVIIGILIVTLLWVFVFRRRSSQNTLNSKKGKSYLNQDPSLDKEEARARIRSDRMLPHYRTKPSEEESSNEEREKIENQQGQRRPATSVERPLLVNIPKEPSKLATPPTSALEPFNSAKNYFLEYLKKSFYAAPDEQKIKDGYAKVQTQLKAIRTQVPKFVDKENPFVQSTLPMDEFVQTYFTSELKETTKKYDTLLTESCNYDVAEFERLFKAWLAWIKRFKIDLDDRAHTEWIAFTDYSRAKNWCAVRFNPAIYSTSLFSYLKKLYDENKTTIAIPNDMTGINSEFIMQVIEDAEEKALSKAVNEAKELTKDIVRNYLESTAKNPKEAHVFSTYYAAYQARKMVIKWFISNKTDFDTLLAGTITSEQMITKIKEKKTRSFLDISTVLAQLLDFHILYKDPNREAVKMICSLHFQALAHFYEAREEDQVVVEAVLRLAENAHSMSEYERALAWGTVAMNVKDTTEISAKKAKDLFEALGVEKFTRELFHRVNGDKLGVLRKNKDITVMLLSAKNAKNVLDMVSRLKLDLHGTDDVYEYFTALSLLFNDPTESIFGILAESTTSLPDKKGSIVLAYIKDIANRIVPQEISACRANFLEKFQLPQKIIKHLKKSNEAAELIKKWADFGTEYEFMISSGLDKNGNEEFYTLYRRVKEEFTKANLTQFLTLLLGKSEEYRDKYFMERLLIHVCSHGALCEVTIKKLLWKIKNVETLTTIIMKLCDEGLLSKAGSCKDTFYTFPFLLDNLEDDIIRDIFTGNVKFPNTFDFKHSPQFVQFKEAFEVFSRKYRVNSIISHPAFVPSIGFIRPLMMDLSSPETTALITAFKELAKVIGDPEIQHCMNTEAAQIDVTVANL